MQEEQETMTQETPQRCIRCYAWFASPPYIMAGRPYCCQSCSVGSACEHQGVLRPTNVRRFDANFDRFRQTVKRKSPYEDFQPGEAR
ncbi:MAG: hypothetical protein M0R74_19880 [Dehalococcoidia bacterium]|nr:hypothetical protein [Dehalococcoidia bacterium]